jgi:hypothetical protein
MTDLPLLLCKDLLCFIKNTRESFLGALARSLMVPESVVLGKCSSTKAFKHSLTGHGEESAVARVDWLLVGSQRFPSIDKKGQWPPKLAECPAFARP